MSSERDKNSPSIENIRGDEIWGKAKENPLVPIGIAGGLVAFLFSAYTFHRKGIPKSSKVLDLSRSRNAAQGIVVSALTIGAFYYQFHDLMNEKKDK